MLWGLRLSGPIATPLCFRIDDPPDTIPDSGLEEDIHLLTKRWVIEKPVMPVRV